jgi:3,4-dihydroxy 2-butanone 4-phosphate synthase/GTP cyclohydrolase II
MVKENSALLGTAFTVSVDAKKGTTTGISAYDRAVTIQALVDPSTTPQELARPGHVFPLVAHAGGVLARPGHTEAVVDLALAAGMKPAGVLCEILGEDGRMARLPKLIELAEKFKLKITSVGDIIDYRYRTEKLVRKVTDVHLPSVYGTFRLHLYESILNPSEHHLALVKGEISENEPVLLRIHSECLTGDTFGSLRCDCGDQLHTALRKIEHAGSGALIYLKQEGRGIGLANKILAYQLQDEGKDTVEANEALGFKADLREYWFAAQMIKDLGIKKVKLMTNNPRKVQGLNEYGIEVEERLPIIMDANPVNEKYLRTKSEKLGHFINGKEG